VRVLSTCVDFEVTQLCSAERPAREHPLDGESNDVFWMTVSKLRSGRALEAPYVSSVSVVHFVAPLFTCERDFISINDDDIVSIIDVRSKSRLVLAAEHVSDL
jgi:hypothetical protein